MKYSEFDNFFMQEALFLAEKAYYQGEVPVGAVITDRQSKTIIAKSYNIMEQEKNPLMHAEIIAINEACCELNNKYLSNCDIYVSLEPCIMCTAAISYTRISRLFYAAPDLKQGGVEHGARFFTRKQCFHRPEVYIGLLSENSEQLIKGFFRKVRKNDL